MFIINLLNSIYWRKKCPEAAGKTGNCAQSAQARPEASKTYSRHEYNCPARHALFKGHWREKLRPAPEVAPATKAAERHSDA